MTAAAAVISLAPATQPAPTPVRAGAREGAAFEATLDTFDLGKGKTKSTEQRRDEPADETSDAATRPPTDLRATLIGSALASLAAAPSFGAGAATEEQASDVSGSLSRPSTANGGSPPTAAAYPERTPASGRLAPQVKATAVRTFFAPARSLIASACGLASSASVPSDAVAIDGLRSAADDLSVSGPDIRQAWRSAAAKSSDPALSPAPSLTSAMNGGKTAETTTRNQTPAGATTETATAAPVAVDARSRLPAAGSAPARRPTSAATHNTGSAPAASAAEAGAAHAPSTPSRSNAHEEGGNETGSSTDPGQNPASAFDPASAAPLDAASILAGSTNAPATASEFTTASVAAPRQTLAAPAPAQTAAKVREIDVDLSPAGAGAASMTVRLTGDRLGVVVRAASSQTAAVIEGARDAIADRLAAIGQPVNSFIIQQTGVSDATGESGQSAGGRDDGARRQQDGGAGDPDQRRRGASRD